MFYKSFCGLRRAHINTATHPAPVCPLYGLAGGNVVPVPDHASIEPATVNVAVNRLPGNTRCLFQVLCRHGYTITHLAQQILKFSAPALSGPFSDQGVQLPAESRSGQHQRAQNDFSTEK